MKASELRGLGVDELEDKIGKLKQELMQYRFQTKTGKLEQQSMKAKVRHDIARVLTVINEKKAEVQS